MAGGSTQTAEKPSTPITQTPEFEQAVAAKVAEAMQGAMAEIQAMLNTARGKSAPVPEDQKFVNGLAMAISKLSDQGTGRKHIDPEVLQNRERSRTEMFRLLVEARAKGLVAKYKVTRKTYLDEILIDPVWIDPATKQQMPTIIDWPGVPNDAMVPHNEVAMPIHAAFRGWVGQTEAGIPGERPLAGVTAGGLVVHKGGHAMRPVQPVGDATEPHGEGLRIPHREAAKGGVKQTRVLGTVAQPATEQV